MIWFRGSIQETTAEERFVFYITAARVQLSLATYPFVKFMALEHACCFAFSNDRASPKSVSELSGQVPDAMVPTSLRAVSFTMRSRYYLGKMTDERVALRLKRTLESVKKIPVKHLGFQSNS